MPLQASEILNRAAGHLLERAITYDAPSGERSMEKTVTMFSALIAEKLREPLDEMVRSHQGDFKADNFLAGEAALKMAEKR